MGYLKLKINNSKKAAIPIKKTVRMGKQWKDPGAKLYNQLLNAQYIIGDKVPDDAKEFEQLIKDGKYITWQTYLQEAYMVAPVSDIKNSPYGVTPFSRSGCKYPHHVIKNGELVVSIPGLRAAYICARNQGVLVNHTPENKKIVAHFNRHFKELGLKPEWHYGEFYLVEEVDSRINNNFREIYSFIMEKTGINLFNEPDDEYIEEKSHGSLKYEYRMGIDVKTGKQVAVQFKINPDKITYVGNDNAYEIAHLLNNPNDFTMAKKVYNEIDRLKNSGDFNAADDLEKRLKSKYNSLTKDAKAKALDAVKRSITKTGHIDHITDELMVDKIFFRNGSSVDSVEMIPTLSDNIKHFLRYYADGVDKYNVTNPSSYHNQQGTHLSYRDVFDDESVQKQFVDWCKDTRVHGEKYVVGTMGGKGKYKTTKLSWNMLTDFMKFTKSPVVRGQLTRYKITKNDKEYNGYNRPTYAYESAMSNEAITLNSSTQDEIGRTPESIYEWMHANVKYDKELINWRLRTPSETYLDKKGNCHDQSLFVSFMFHSLNIVNGQLFFVEFRKDDPVGGNAHTLTWFRKGGNGYSDFKEPYDEKKKYTGKYEYYWFENAWEDQAGIHGPYDSIDDIKNAVFEVYRQDNDINSHNYNGIVFGKYSNYRCGMTMGEYVNSWRLEDDYLFTDESVDSIGESVNTEYIDNVSMMEYADELMSWIHNFVNDDEFNESVYENQIMTELDDAYYEFMSLVEYMEYYSEDVATDPNEPHDLKAFKKRWNYDESKKTITFENRAYSIELNSHEDNTESAFVIITDGNPVIHITGRFWDNNAITQDAVVLHEIGHIVYQYTPKPLPRSIKELIQYIKKLIQKLVARLKMKRYTRGIHGNGYRELEADMFALQRIPMETYKKALVDYHVTTLDRLPITFFEDNVKKQLSEESIRKEYNAWTKKDLLSFDEYKKALIRGQAVKQKKYLLQDIRKNPAKYADLNQRMKAADNDKLRNSKYFKKESEDVDLMDMDIFNESTTLKNIPDKMYFGTCNKLQGRTISAKSPRGLFLTPYVGIASMFIIDLGKELDEYLSDILKKNGRELIHHSCNIDYDEWNNDDLSEPLDSVHMSHNIPEFNEIKTGTTSGYIYQVDVSRIKNQLQSFVGDDSKELVYKGDDKLPITGMIPHTIEWSLKYKSNGERGTFETRVLKESAYLEDVDSKISNISYLNDEYETPEELFKWMHCIDYGFLDESGNIIDEDETHNVYKKYRLQSPDSLIQSKIGVCWDQTLLERSWFEHHKFTFAELYIEIHDDENCPSHTLIIYLDKDKNDVVWFEHSWINERGIHRYKDVKKCMDDIIDRFLKSHSSKMINTNLLIKRIDKPVKPRSTMQQYMDHVYKEYDIKLGDISEDKIFSFKNINESVDEEPPQLSEDSDNKQEPEEKQSIPKQTDAAESNKNGVRRKKLYIAFIEWCKAYNNKNVFGSIFDKDAFKITYPFIPEEMRYFYRLANPILCVLGGDLTFFQASELRKLNSSNHRMSEMLIFAATPNDMRIFNIRDKKVYRGTTENGQIKLNEVLGSTFDLYIQNMIKQGDILNGPIEESFDEGEFL